MGTYEGLYCVACEAYYAEDELIDGNCPIHGRPVEHVTEENYFFKLSRYEDILLRHYDEHPEAVQPDSRRNEVIAALARHPLVDSFDLSQLRLVNSGAAPLKAELAAECSKRLGCEVVQGYGMTELSPVSHLTPPGWFKPGSVGITAPDTQTRIVDPVTQADLGTGEEGEVCVRGPQVMAGYLNNPQATAATVDADGWLHTGDLGYMDADGHLYVVDRLKELIKYKGFQVPPAELEAVLLRHPDVADAAVIGLPDDEAGEIPVGYVVLRPGAAASPEEIMRFVAGEVARYKQIRPVVQRGRLYQKGASAGFSRRPCSMSPALRSEACTSSSRSTEKV